VPQAKDRFVNVGTEAVLFPFFVVVVDIEGSLHVGAVWTAHFLLLFGDPIGHVVSPASFFHEGVEDKDFLVVGFAAVFKTPLEEFFVGRAGGDLVAEALVIYL